MALLPTISVCCLFLQSIANRHDEAVQTSGLAQMQASETRSEPQYSTNAICTEYNCINPVVPGMSDLAQLSATTWQCQDVYSVKKYMSFCKNALYYNPAVPNPAKAMNLTDVVITQDDAASTMYFYALNGMNVEPWNHRKPWEEGDACLTSIWKTVCSTYFPRAEAGCKAGEPTKYLKPCKNVCQNYLKACQVQCCDESVQCVFTHTKVLGTTSISTSGYVNHDGPSSLCTGGAHRASAPAAALFGLALSLMMAVRR